MAHRLTAKGMIDPVFVQQAKSGLEGTITESGTVAFDSSINQTVILNDRGAIDPDTRVKVSLTRGGFPQCETFEEIEEAQREREREQQRREQQREAKRRADLRERRDFWDSYDIPFDHETGIKNRLSGLSRGSWGDGRAGNTVDHLFVREAFEEGRLSRGENEYLCANGAVYPHDEYPQTGDDDVPEPKVTCKACLKLMERWKNGQ